MSNANQKIAKLRRSLTRLNHHLVWWKTKQSPSVARYLSPPSQNQSVAEFAADGNYDSSNTGNEWDDFRAEILQEFDANPTSFLRQRIISRCLHPVQQDRYRGYLDEMGEDAWARENIFPLLYDSPVGDPYLSHYFPHASSLSLQHAYYHFMLHKKISEFASSFPIPGVDTIVEFGGGYGNFCRLTYNFGYDGNYHIIDLPELHYIQRYFLERVLPRRVQKIKFHPSINSADAGKTTLFIGTYSVCETPITMRQEIENHYHKFDYLFLTYGKLFGEIDNLMYFEGLKNRLQKDFDIQIIPDSHHADCCFFLGHRR